MVSRSLSYYFLIITFSLFILTGGAAVANPKIELVEGPVRSGSQISIIGSGFSDKVNDKPLFYWNADEGLQPSSLGRLQQWAGELNGELSEEVVAPSSERSFTYDHSSSGAALAGIEFNSDRLFVHRKTYEDFDVTKDYAIRARFSNLQGTINPGQTVIGAESGATGIVQSLSQSGAAIFFSNDGGTINQSPRRDFIYGERMFTATGSAINSEGSETYPTGTYRTFNFKTFRMWNSKYKNNIHVGAGSWDPQFNILTEYTGAMFWAKYMTDPLRQQPFEWKTEEVYYQASDIGMENGILDFRVNNQDHYDHKFKMRSEAKPGVYNILYQSQVSNGAQPGSNIYYDQIYVDDSWHHVALCGSSSWSDCTEKVIQIPLSWTDTEVKVQVDFGELSDEKEAYLYVVDGSGQANSKGFRVCPNCPAATDFVAN